MSDVFLSIAVAVSAVASLVDSFPMLYLAWVSGGFGLFFGAAGFLGLNFRPEWLAQFWAPKPARLEPFARGARPISSAADLAAPSLRSASAPRPSRADPKGPPGQSPAGRTAFLRRNPRDREPACFGLGDLY